VKGKVKKIRLACSSHSTIRFGECAHRVKFPLRPHLHRFSPGRVRE
jgi:hypothetical protein